MGSTSGQVGNLLFYDVTAAANRMVINSAGNVGIGTTSPVGKLDVSPGGSQTAGDLVVGTTDTMGSTPGIAGTVHIGRLSSMANDNTAFNVRNRVGVSRFFVNTGGGNVGIGGTAPAATLDVAGDVSDAITAP